MIRVRFYRAASIEAEAAVRWYNERVPGLGDDFRAELIAAVEWIVEGPYLLQLPLHVPMLLPSGVDQLTAQPRAHKAGIPSASACALSGTPRA